MMNQLHKQLAILLIVFVTNFCRADDNSELDIHTFNPSLSSQLDEIQQVLGELSGDEYKGQSLHELKTSLTDLEMFLTSKRLKQLTNLAGMVRHSYECNDHEGVCGYNILFTQLSTLSSDSRSVQHVAVSLKIYDESSGWSEFKSRFYVTAKKLCPTCSPRETVLEHVGTTDSLYENILHYGGLVSYPLLKLVYFGWTRHGEELNLGGNYPDHFVNNEVLSANLEMAEVIPEVIRDHELTQTTPEFDGAIATYILMATATTVSMKGFSVDKTAITPPQLMLYYLLKASANMLTKGLNEYHSKTTYAHESDPLVRKSNSAFTTSWQISLPFIVMNFVLPMTGRKLDGNMLITIPFEHLFSCAVSNVATTVQIMNHKILGELDFQLESDSSVNVTNEVLNGFSHLTAGAEFAVIGLPLVFVPDKTVSTLGKHAVKGSGYLVLDSLQTNLQANEFSPTTVSAVLSAVSLVTDRVLFQLTVYMDGSKTMVGKGVYKFLFALTPGFGNRYAKYSIHSITFTILTAVPMYFSATGAL